MLRSQNEPSGHVDRQPHEYIFSGPVSNGFSPDEHNWTGVGAAVGPVGDLVVGSGDGRRVIFSTVGSAVGAGVQ